MVKTTVYLDDDMARSLRLLSERHSKLQAELIREALRRFAAERPPLPEGMGMFDSGHSDTTLRRKQLLKQAAQRGGWRS
ncbi:MAG: ribbon-helix-helix protein, CopG family [Bryobacterales bacterium]|nr:ribbon-helix-helix protein, CopG family [Bryobacterales bacterium]MBV9399236.1 ribbon-helix-helix protein, CopG family [Bryobacterales bacterium]